MTQPEPDSSPEYNPYELFTEELDLDEFDLEPTSPPKAIAPPQETTADPFVTQDEDRLYTDELIRQNEMASRSLFLSAIAAAIISVGIGLWYLWSQKPTPTPQPVAPLPVPEQPGLAPNLNPSGLNPQIAPSPLAPSLPVTPSNQGSPLAPTDSGIVPGGLPSPSSTLPAQSSPSGAVPPPPPPPSPIPGNPNR